MSRRRVEQLPRTEPRFDPHRTVEERSLLDGTDWLGFPDLRNAANLDVVLGRKEPDRP